jgi:hypothetical protein
MERSGRQIAQSFGDESLDASALILPIIGFLPADDLRVRGTVRAIAERLTDPHGLVYRCHADDGMEGEEGSFLLCTFWLAEAQALAGDVDAARQTFERAARFVNTWGCSPSRSTRRLVNRSATSRGRSATSTSSTPPGRSTRRRRGRVPGLNCCRRGPPTARELDQRPNRSSSWPRCWKRPPGPVH